MSPKPLAIVAFGAIGDSHFVVRHEGFESNIGDIEGIVVHMALV